MIGMLAGVVVGVFGISHLMATRPEMLWAFFFGLIIASAIYVGKQVKKWNISVIALLVIGALLAFWITQITPTEASTNPLYVFLCGMIAISALILPGISGSFIMLLMGMYTVIIPMVKSLIKDLDFSVLGTLSFFGIGCMVGLLTFSRVMSWMFKNYSDQTLGLLSGFMIGSLFKIWPWRNPVSWMDDSGKLMNAEEVAQLPESMTEHIRIISELNVMPGQYSVSDPQTLLVIVSAVVGFAIVFLLEKFVGGDTLAG
jgi:putative membrane protein